MKHAFLSGSCSKTEVSEQLSYTRHTATNYGISIPYSRRFAKPQTKEAVAKLQFCNSNRLKKRNSRLNSDLICVDARKRFLCVPWARGVPV
jgi:hypothetical protein